MAGRKPTPPKKKKKPALPRVLGNDPFMRGSAVREISASAPSSAPPREPLPVTPELVQAKKKPTSKAEPTAPRRPLSPAGVRAVGVNPQPHAASPSVVADPQSHADAPTARTLNGPTAHAASPSVVVDLEPHADAPTAKTISGPIAHAASPSVVIGPQPHAGAPMGVERGELPARSPPGEREIVATPTFTDALKGVVNAARVAAGLASRTSSVDRWGKDATLSTSLRPLAELLYDKYWRVRVEGAERLPAGPCIIVANHAGALPLDGPVLHLALRRERPDLEESRWLLEDQIFHAPFIGVLANRLGAVRANPENALRLLEERRPVIVFPEGFHGLSKPFSERYQLKRFGRGGYLKIALKAGVPVIPAAIVGGEESMPLLGKIPGGLFGVQYVPITLPPLPARWHIRFAAPISMEGAPQEPEHDLAWVERKNLAVRDQVEAMLLDMLHHRDRVF